MAGVGFLALSGQVSGTPTSSGAVKAIQLPTVSIASAAYSERAVTLASGDNTVNLPTGTTTVVLIPGTSNATAWGLGASSAVACALTRWQVINVAADATSIVVHAGASMTITVVTL